jgi:hypothetical protein
MAAKATWKNLSNLWNFILFPHESLICYSFWCVGCCSVSSLRTTTEAVVADFPKEEKEMVGMGGVGGGGMGGMDY